MQVANEEIGAMKQLLLPFVIIATLLLVSLACAIFVFCFVGLGDACDLSILQEAEIHIPTVLGYFISLPLLWLGWRWTAKAKDDWRRIVLRCGLLASAFTPSIISDPGVTFVFVVPAWVPTLAYAFFPPVALAVGGLPISAVWLVLLLIATALF
jgi:hypothetical protein